MTSDLFRKFFWYNFKILPWLLIIHFNGEIRYSHTFIDAAGDWLDTVFFPQVANYSNVNGKGFYSMKGKVVEEFGVYFIEVNYCKRVDIKNRAQKAMN